MEIWKSVKDYEGLYEISNLGRVKSLGREKLALGKYPFLSNEFILKNSLSLKGYYRVKLYKKQTKSMKQVHVLVAESFLNHKTCGMKLVVDHINNIKTDNRVDNLRIVTNRQNCNRQHIKSSSKYVGVSWDNFNKKWKSQIQINGKKKHLGLFNSEIEASEYYENALKSILEGKDVIPKKSLAKGYSWSKNRNKWVAFIWLNGKNKHLGYFIDEIDARNAYEIALKSILE